MARRHLVARTPWQAVVVDQVGPKPGNFADLEVSFGDRTLSNSSSHFNPSVFGFPYPSPYFRARLNFPSNGPCSTIDREHPPSTEVSFASWISEFDSTELANNSPGMWCTKKQIHSEPCPANSSSSQKATLCGSRCPDRFTKSFSGLWSWKLVTNSSRLA